MAVCLSSGSEGAEDSRVHALRGVHRSARFRYSQGHAQSCGGRRHHHQATHSRLTTPVHIVITLTHNGDLGSNNATL